MYNFSEIISDRGLYCWEGVLSKCAVPENIHIPPTDGIEFPGGMVGRRSGRFLGNKNVLRNVRSLNEMLRGMEGLGKKSINCWGWGGR